MKKGYPDSLMAELGTTDCAVGKKPRFEDDEVYMRAYGLQYEKEQRMTHTFEQQFEENDNGNSTQT